MQKQRENRMKYRILNDGKDYIIQEKIVIFWHTLKYCAYGGHEPIFCPVRVKTEKEAEFLAKKNWGSKAERIRKYRVV